MTALRPNLDFAYSLARAFGGAIIFGLPLLMTMEMWSIGLYVHPLRLLLFIAANFVVLVFLSRFGGFERTANLREDMLDAFAAYAVGMISSVAILCLFGLLSRGTALDELVGMVAIQAVPGSFGAMIARKQLTGGDPDEGEDEDEAKAARSAGYAGQLFLMLAGALFLAFNVAPTEEMILIAYKMNPWQILLLMLASMLLLHILVFAVGFAGQEEPEGFGIVRRFLLFTVPGYAIALAVSFYVLWTFGRVDGNAFAVIAETMVVLGFPAAIGAAIARLVV
ncbi:TIGR02587 family membrane protein [Sphingomonas gei]|uniref:TIGR02587 family membrane protein n=1 Tax=Sphingomonas gei TaxID=1395960 RepID=A0A4S1X959_9SPHN|nr:TIGR02587 family membrane protein [Sphingomonas gei]TGX52283.1 TIGR02587 family membrane protein [Sphingomonas gei]